MPFTLTFENDALLDAGQYEDLISTLTANDRNLNPRGIMYIEYRDSNYRDPWGNDYQVAFDFNYDNQIDARDVHGYSSGNLNTNMAIWSKGPDGKDHPFDNHEYNRDNIESWIE